MRVALTSFVICWFICASTMLNAQPPKNERRSFAAVKAEAQTLYVKDTAWRKIAWKTTLLEGLHASRAQKKPAILWVFIDRPIDDERC